MNAQEKKEKKIVIVDDNEQNLKLLDIILKHMGLSTIQAMTGTEALKIIKESDPDLVLLDIQIPEITGVEVLYKLREIERFKNLPVIAVTAYAMIGDEEKLREAGFTDYMSKPLDIKLLQKKIRLFLDLPILNNT